MWKSFLKHNGYHWPADYGLRIRVGLDVGKWSLFLSSCKRSRAEIKYLIKSSEPYQQEEKIVSQISGFVSIRCNHFSIWPARGFLSIRYFYLFLDFFVFLRTFKGGIMKKKSMRIRYVVRFRARFSAQITLNHIHSRPL